MLASSARLELKPCPGEKGSGTTGQITLSASPADGSDEVESAVTTWDTERADAGESLITTFKNRPKSVSIQISDQTTDEICISEVALGLHPEKKVLHSEEFWLEGKFCKVLLEQKPDADCTVGKREFDVPETDEPEQDHDGDDDRDHSDSSSTSFVHMGVGRAGGCRDCDASWAKWGECEGGKKVRKWKINQHPRNGGYRCENRYPRRREGQEDVEKCGTNCTAYWTDWHECVAGKQHRKYVIEDPPPTADGVQCNHTNREDGSPHTEWRECG